MAENQKLHPRIRMDAQRVGLEIAWALVMLKIEGPRIMEKGGVLENIYRKSSYHRLKKAEAGNSSSSASFGFNEEEQEEKADDQQNQQYLPEEQQ